MKRNLAPLMTSKSGEHTTPRALFDTLNVEFDFEVDLAATRANALCERYYTKRDSALDADWREAGLVGFCNPPYTRGIQGAFIAKAARMARQGFTTVMLLPARTDTAVFHDFIWNVRHHIPRRGVEVRFLRGRLKFGNATHGAPFPSMIVIFRGR